MTRSRTDLRAVPDQPRRGLGLIRVSKARGRDDLISPILQRTAIEDYAARNGITVVEWVEALDESASRSRSPWWRRLEAAVAAVEAHERDVVLVWKVSRAARHRRNWAVAVDRIETAGGTLESATEGLDTSTSTGRLARGMLAELAAWESEVKGEQWKEAQARRRSLGLPHSGGYRPGYIYKDKAYLPDPEVAPLIAEAYGKFVAGMGRRRLAEWLRAVGVPARRGQWTYKSAQRMLESGWAAGFLHVHDPGCGCPNKGGSCEQRIHVPGSHEPIVDAKLWKAYQAERARRSTSPRRLLTPSTPLSGLVRCAACGYGMRLKQPGRSRSYPLYACAHPGCPMPTTVVVSRAEAAALEWLRGYAHDVDQATAIAASDRATRTAAKSTVTRLARAVNQLDVEMAKLVREYARGVIPEGAYLAARDELTAERGSAQSALDEASRQLGPARPSRAVAAGLLADWPIYDVADRNRICRELLRVVAARGGRRSTVTVVPPWEWSPPAR